MLPFLALPQKSNQKKSRQNEATTHKATAGPPFCLPTTSCLSRLGLNFKQPNPRPSEENNGLVKIAIVFEGRFLAMALASDALKDLTPTPSPFWRGARGEENSSAASCVWEPSRSLVANNEMVTFGSSQK